MDLEHDFFGILEDLENLNVIEEETLEPSHETSQIESSVEAILELLASDFVLCKISSGFYVEELPVSSELLFVFDLNGTLICEERYYNRHKKSYNRRFYLRDYCRVLLDFLCKHCRVAVWSSAIFRNTQIRSRFAFDMYYEKLLFVWDRSQCTKKYSDKNPHATEKDLQKVWKKISGTEAKNTVIVDDDHYKVESYPRNCILVVPATKSNNSDSEKDPTLLRLLWYIEYLHLGMSRVDDVRVIMDVLPFRRFVQLIEWFSPKML
ncbi:uncharacterized protein Gasu_58160 [Galdieria sulphuraria]|uniref:Mitochondrial import inner membrane translocase subunit TIM50 n=1 Tax=Galdieria sulphuraria TaxID=130081 RepID=M2XSD3_GALSU|nr:uncharacterized protein Gasu_58160 [Galdieria sulphuraria]EME26583.1 hypothetical protein Gasu_58160 [Galdieria sulphuraria]|eukprot:XP_005703103.1 hypothetical protein Gasu_58160 [Galdieria sulphuraria]